MKNCTVCNSPISSARLKALPSTKTCITCSNEDKWSAIPIIHHKTGNEIEIIKDAKSAETLLKLTARRGCSSMAGLRAGSSKGSKHSIEGLIASVGEASPERFNSIGEQMMNVFDIYGLEKAEQFIMESYSRRAISGAQRVNLQQILRQFSETEKPMEIPKKVVPKYNPYGKFEPPTPKKIVSKEIEDAFRNWKR